MKRFWKCLFYLLSISHFLCTTIGIIPLTTKRAKIVEIQSYSRLHCERTTEVDEVQIIRSTAGQLHNSLDSSSTERVNGQRKLQFKKLRSLSSRPLYIWQRSIDSEAFKEKECIALAPGASMVVCGWRDHAIYYTSTAEDPSANKPQNGDDPDDYLVGSIDMSSRSEDGNFILLEDKEQFRISEESVKEAELERKFQTYYHSKTGSNWYHYFDWDGPRAPVTLPIIAAPFVGFRHQVTSSESYWLDENKRMEGNICLSLETVSTSPKVFVIKNFMSHFETNKVIEAASKQRLETSRVAENTFGESKLSAGRTSSNTWLDRDTNSVTESIYRRVSDLLGTDEAAMNENGIAEMLQVVHYQNGQKYDSHFDWTIGQPYSRFATLLLYLTDRHSESAGGETSFPAAESTILTSDHDDGSKTDSLGVYPLNVNTARDAPEESSLKATSRGQRHATTQNFEGFKVHPGKGGAVLFYNLLQDGNADVRSIHAALPVLEGEKWLANMWVWDPKIPKRAQR